MAKRTSSKKLQNKICDSIQVVSTLAKSFQRTPIVSDHQIISERVKKIPTVFSSVAMQDLRIGEFKKKKRSILCLKRNIDNSSGNLLVCKKQRSQFLNFFI